MEKKKRTTYVNLVIKVRIMQGPSHTIRTFFLKKNNFSNNILDIAEN